MPRANALLRRFAVGGFLAAIVVAPVLAADTPDATLSLKGGAVAFVAGYSWGSGTLNFKGRHYPVKVGGLSVVDVGASKYTATGDVFHLTKIEDIEGTYTAAEAGATVGGGVSVQSMKNPRGVLIKLKSSRAGLQFTAAPKGVTIELKK
ncbi:hypothetical protein [Phenylobacterium sp.]|jgi:hypothetical protein|uniref:hypothetical protein n=1 Tax=Phenylobacterium sp. TaxID=1871053 RepID=UPI002F401A9D